MSEVQHDYGDVMDEKSDVPNDNALAALSSLAEQLEQAELAEAEAEAAYNKAKDKTRDLAERQVPELMEAVGMKKFTTASGLNIDVTEKIRVSVPKANKDAAMDFFDENGMSGLVKRKIAIEFEKEEERWANKFLADCRKRKQQLRMNIGRDVAPATVTKQISDLLNAGKTVPEDVFSIFRQRIAKVSRG